MSEDQKAPEQEWSSAAVATVASVALVCFTLLLALLIVRLT